MLDDFVPEPRLLEIDAADVAAAPELVDRIARELDMRRSPLVRCLFELRELPARLRGRRSGPVALRLATRIAMGPVLVEPVGFVMDRKMLLGIKARAETRARQSAR